MCSLSRQCIVFVFFQDDNKTTITQSFADKSHSGSIRCVAVKDKWVATGATDDRIFIYDMSIRKQSQVNLRGHDFWHAELFLFFRFYYLMMDPLTL